MHTKHQKDLLNHMLNKKISFNVTKSSLNRLQYKSDNKARWN